MFQNKINYLFALLGICMFDSCQPKDTFKWNAGLSGPKYYGNGGPFVEYFYHGQSIGGASTGGANQGWGITNSSASAGERFKPVPDSIFVKWLCSADRYKYEGGVKLPRKKMLELFEKGTVDPFGHLVQYGLITAGMAPGGNVTVWLQGGLASTEICKFKIKKNDDYKENAETEKIEKEIFTSYEFLNSEVNIFRYLHDIPYKIWETGEKEYKYDIGFTSEDDQVRPKITTFHTKDGSWYQSWVDKGAINSIDIYKWNTYEYQKNNNLKTMQKLPVQIDLKWNLIDQDKMMHGIIVMPQNLEKLVKTSYKDTITDKQDFYDRIIIGSFKGGNKGILWLAGKNKKIKLMEFIMLDSEDKNIKSYYSLPKGFVFPKWEGREPLKTPEIDYWQEK